MKYKCSLNNNYETIGLCDVDKFNEKISRFMDKSWTQLTMPEKLELPSNKPSIKTITKVYIDIKINLSKIIKTPTSNKSSIEGLTVTGNILLVSGEVWQNIFYISKDYTNSIHSYKFQSSFSTYIVIEENVDINIDKYCVYPCVENLHVGILDEKTLSKSVNLFLYAHKITQNIPPVKNIANAFIFKTFDTDEEMARVEFDKINKKLIVTSTGKNYNDPRASSKIVFIFRLTNLATGVVIRSEILGNANANSFKANLNDVDFDFGYIINIVYVDKSKVLLTNHPTFGTDYSMISDNSQSFKITPDEIVPYVLPNKITLNAPNNFPVVNVQFDIISKQLLVTSTGNLTGAGGQNYFKMTLFSSNGVTEKASSFISGNSTGDRLLVDLNSEDFEFNDVLKLEYEDRNKVIVTNFPNTSTPIYNPPRNTQSFRITQAGLTNV